MGVILHFFLLFPFTCFVLAADIVLDLSVPALASQVLIVPPLVTQSQTGVHLQRVASPHLRRVCKPD
jgi:hypothetical protein